MRLRHAMLTGLALLAFTAAPASAQWFVTPYAGGQFGGETQENHFNLGGGVGFLGAGMYGFEADFNYAPNFFNSTDAINFSDTSGNLSTVMFNGMIAAPTRMVVRPYGSGGIGFMKRSVEDVGSAFAVKNNDLGFNVGGGLIAQFNDHVGWRTDVRYFRAVVDNEEDNEFDVALGSFDFWRATAGLTFSF
jgi:Outer membrane protein beta-barrel domain